MDQGDATHFRRVCEQAGLAVTHQRQVIYETLCSIDGHPSPEEVFARVKQSIPSISLATVYKNLHLFIDSGIFQRVSLHHGSMRVETNHTRHYHLLCTGCKMIYDVDPQALGISELPRELPGGFRMDRLAIDVLGLCAACQAESAGDPAPVPSEPGAKPGTMVQQAPQVQQVQ